MPFFEKNSGRSGGLRLNLAHLVLFAVAVVMSMGSPALAQQEDSGSAPDRGPSSKREVEAFFDGYLGHQLEDYDIPARRSPS